MPFNKRKRVTVRMNERGKKNSERKVENADHTDHTYHSTNELAVESNRPETLPDCCNTPSDAESSSGSTSVDYVPVMREQSSPPASQYYDQDANGNLTEISGPEFFLNEECIPEYSSDQAHYIETETEPDQEAETQTPTDDSSLSLPVHHENNHTAPHSSTASACEPTHNFFCNLGAHLKIATMPDY